MKHILYVLAVLLVLLAAHAHASGPFILMGALRPATFPPNAPTGVTATPGDAQNTLTWTNSVPDSSHGGATSYDLLWGTSSGSEPNTITGVTSGYAHTGRTNGTAYYYKVRANNGAGSTTSSEVSGTPVAYTGFTDTFTASDGTAPSTTNWTALYQLNSAKMSAGSYFNIQGNALKSHLQSTDGTLLRNIYYSANSLSTQGGRYVEWTYPANLNPASTSNFIIFTIYNADDNNPEAGTLRPQKNLVYFYLNGASGSVVGNITGVSSTGTTADSSQRTDNATGGKTYRLELVGTTQARLLVNGSQVIAPFTHGATLGTNIKMHVQALSASTSSFTYDTAVDDISFK